MEWKHEKKQEWKIDHVQEWRKEKKLEWKDEWVQIWRKEKKQIWVKEKKEVIGIVKCYVIQKVIIIKLILNRSGKKKRLQFGRLRKNKNGQLRRS